LASVWQKSFLCVPSGASRVATVMHVFETTPKVHPVAGPTFWSVSWIMGPSVSLMRKTGWFESIVFDPLPVPGAAGDPVGLAMVRYADDGPAFA
jgi:hypothetical protein